MPSRVSPQNVGWNKCSVSSNPAGNGLWPLRLGSGQAYPGLRLFSVSLSVAISYLYLPSPISPSLSPPRSEQLFHPLLSVPAFLAPHSEQLFPPATLKKAATLTAFPAFPQVNTVIVGRH